MGFRLRRSRRTGSPSRWCTRSNALMSLSAQSSGSSHADSSFTAGERTHGLQGGLSSKSALHPYIRERIYRLCKQIVGDPLEIVLDGEGVVRVRPCASRSAFTNLSRFRSRITRMQLRSPIVCVRDGARLSQGSSGAKLSSDFLVAAAPRPRTLTASRPHPPRPLPRLPRRLRSPSRRPAPRPLCRFPIGARARRAPRPPRWRRP
jgi:hypothetical protein